MSAARCNFIYRIKEPNLPSFFQSAADLLVVWRSGLNAILQYECFKDEIWRNRKKFRFPCMCFLLADI